jgi:hypothetical protein
MTGHYPIHDKKERVIVRRRLILTVSSFDVNDDDDRSCRRLSAIRKAMSHGPPREATCETNGGA